MRESFLAQAQPYPYNTEFNLLSVYKPLIKYSPPPPSHRLLKNSKGKRWILVRFWLKGRRLVLVLRGSVPIPPHSPGESAERHGFLRSGYILRQTVATPKSCSLVFYDGTPGFGRQGGGRQQVRVHADHFIEGGGAGWHPFPRVFFGAKTLYS